MNSHYIKDVFDPGGYLNKTLGDYAVRQGQVDMATEVDECFTKYGVLLAEGPTGTGKTFAYLLPLLHHAMALNGMRNVGLVVTANIALQEQLMEKDLPLLRKVAEQDLTQKELKSTFDHGIAKGRSNFLCLLELERLNNDGPPTAFTHEENDQYDGIVRWSRNTKTGDVSELPFTPHLKVWNQFSVAPGECIEQKCPHYDGCHYYRRKKGMYSKNIIVTNYAMFFLNVVSGGKVLPPYDFVVLDEGHKIVDIAREHLGVSLAPSRIRKLVRMSRRDIRRTASDAIDSFFGQLTAYQKSDYYSRRIKNDFPIDVVPLKEAVLACHKNYMAMIASSAITGDSVEKQAVELEKYKKLAEGCEAVIKDLEWVTRSDNDGWVRFLEESKSGSILRAKPVDIRNTLYEKVFKKGGVVVTSATLTDGQSFTHAQANLGATNAKTFKAPSPFDWEKQAALILQPQLPDPSKDRDSFNAVIGPVIVEIIRLMKGRTLALFTSYNALESAYDLCKKCHLGYTLLKQGDAPRTELVNRFKQDVSSVLFGTESFWAGVDVPGEALSCVVIDKLPFPTPDDPVVDYIVENDPNWFNSVFIPHARTALRQGVGRLIRSNDDRGVVVILDPRIRTKDYGKQFIDSLPKMEISHSINDIPKLLRRLA